MSCEAASVSDPCSPNTRKAVPAMNRSFTETYHPVDATTLQCVSNHTCPTSHHPCLCRWRRRSGTTLPRSAQRARTAGAQLPGHSATDPGRRQVACRLADTVIPMRPVSPAAPPALWGSSAPARAYRRAPVLADLPRDLSARVQSVHAPLPPPP